MVSATSGQRGASLCISLECAPVEGLDRDLALDAGGVDLLEDPADEQAAGGGLLGRAGLHLGLDVQLDLLRVVAP